MNTYDNQGNDAGGPNNRKQAHFDATLGSELSARYFKHDILAKPVLTYGPWHERVRASLMLHFMPFDFQDQPITWGTSKGQIRSPLQMEVNLHFVDGVHIR